MRECVKIVAMNTVRTVFMGSPEFARSILKGLIGEYNLVGVVTQPDRPAGRGKVLTPPPVKVLAQEAGLAVMQPERLRRPEAFDQLAAWQPELIVVAAFGQILRQNVLDLSKWGCINVHASLLPRWRGAAPIQTAILHGDSHTGVTIMKMDAGIDTGGILAQRSIAIDPLDNAASLTLKLADIGATLLLETLPGYLAGAIQPAAQDESLATYAPMIKKEDGLLDFSQPAELLHHKVRAYNPWPGTSFVWDGQTLKVLRSSVSDSDKIQAGQRGIIHGMPAVGTTQGALILEEIQPAGKKPMPGKVFLNGARNWTNTITEVG
ncbi:MAG TPA: methionyl-tRNA formyltransferase [Bellilinea sp.]